MKNLFVVFGLILLFSIKISAQNIDENYFSSSASRFVNRKYSELNLTEIQKNKLIVLYTNYFRDVQKIRESELSKKEKSTQIKKMGIKNSVLQVFTEEQKLLLNDLQEIKQHSLSN